MTGEASTHVKPATDPWRPMLVEGFQLGSARWNGEQMVSDASVVGQSRIMRLGLRERLILESIDGRRTVSDIHAALTAQGLAAPPDVVVASLNRFLAFGLVQRPFTLATPSIEALDARADVAAENLSKVWAAGSREGGPSRARAALASWLAFVLALLAAGAVAIVAAGAAPAAVIALTHATRPLWLVFAVLIAILWNFGVTLAHEGAHMGVFRALSGRSARLSVTRLGIVPMINTQLDGVGLLSPGARVRVVATGPLVSICAVILPSTVFALAAEGSLLQLIGAVALTLDLAIAALALSFFPNTDGSRILEAIASIDQIQAVAFRTISGRYRLPRGLPLVTRAMVRAYPVLLAATVLAVLLAGVLVVRLALS